MNIQDNLGWNEHFKDLVSTLNKRLYAICRVKNQISMDKLPRLAHAIWTSKLRYDTMHQCDARRDTVNDFFIPQISGGSVTYLCMHGPACP